MVVYVPCITHFVYFKVADWLLFAKSCSLG